MKAIRLYPRDLHESGDNRHAQQVIRDLGIEYEDCEPFPIGDCWVFFKVTNIPDDLPKGLELIDLPDNFLDPLEVPKKYKKDKGRVKGRLISMKIGNQVIKLESDLTLKIKK